MDLAFVNSRAMAFVIGVLVGACGSFLTQYATNQRRRQRERMRQRERFDRLRVLMPALLQEIKLDLATNPEVRELVVLTSPDVTFIWPSRHLRYYEQQYPDLRAFLDRVEQAGYIRGAGPAAVPVYRMSDEFVQLVTEA